MKHTYTTTHVTMKLKTHYPTKDVLNQILPLEINEVAPFGEKSNLGGCMIERVTVKEITTTVVDLSKPE